MRKTGSRMLSLAALTFFFSLSSWAQTGQLRGELRGADGQGIPDITVTLERQDTGGNNRYEIATDSRGDFIHLSVAPGDYQISFQVGDKMYLTLARIGVGDIEVELDLANLEYEGYEFSRLSGIVERVVRDIREVNAGTRLIAAPRNDEEAAERAATANREAEMRAAFEAGRAAMAVEDYEEAITQFSIAAEGNTTQHVIFGNLGLAYERAERWEEAVAAYEQAQSIADFSEVLPEEANYYNNLTLAHAMSGNVEQALANAEKAAAVDPGGAAQSFYNIGAVMTNQGDTAGAVQAFERSIEVNPGFADAYYQLGLARFASDTTIPEAVPMLEKYLELAPDGPNAEAARGLLEFARGTP